MSPLAPRPHAAPANELGRLTALLDGLPTLPIVSIRLGEVLHARRSTVDQVAELIGADPSLSAKLLRLVNSSYFGIPGGVTTIAQAIPFVGFNTIYQLALSVSVLETLHTPSGGVYDPRPLWLHSLAVAAAARVVAEDLRQVSGNRRMSRPRRSPTKRAAAGATDRRSRSCRANSKRGKRSARRAATSLSPAFLSILISTKR